MIKVHTIHIGSKHDLLQIKNEDNWGFVHACKTSHKERLGYTRPPKDSPYYIEFEEENHLYLNWVDEPTGKLFKVQTFLNAMDFIDKQISKGREVFIYCDMGQSRSPSLAMTYLAKRTDYLSNNFAEAVKKFRAEYPPFNPNGIIKFISLNWDKIK